MNITNEALQALVLRAYEQGYETGYIVGRCEKDSDEEMFLKSTIKKEKNQQNRKTCIEEDHDFGFDIED